MMMTNRARAAQLLGEMGWTVWSSIPGNVPVRGKIGPEAERAARDAIYRAQDCETIEIAINSPGGSIGCANRIVDDLLQIGLPITARIFGLCGSASTSILATAGVRIGKPSDQMVFHRAVRDLPATRGVSSLALRAMARELDNFDRRYRDELEQRFHLPSHLVTRAVSDAGWSIDGRTGFAWKILTDLVDD